MSDTPEFNVIYNEDCLETMKRLPDNYIDLTITSPPYNLGNNHHTGSKRHSPYDDDLPEKEYQREQIKVLDTLYSKTKSDGSLFYNHKNRIKSGESISPYQWLFKTKWTIKQELVWVNGSQNFDKIRFYPVTERVYWLTKSPDTVLQNNINHNDVFKWSSVGTNQQHTRSFPEQMVSDLLACFPNSVVIYDPYIGSGTVAKVVKAYGKKFIGSEINPDYCEIAEQRLAQGNLFELFEVSIDKDKETE